MKSKYLVVILTFFILFGVNATFASDYGNETLMMHEAALELSVEETPDILGEETGTYADLKKDIDRTPTGGDVKLEKNYKFDSSKDTSSAGIYTCVPITKSITIDAQGHSIDGTGCQRGIFDISANNVILKNIIFMNGYNTGNGGCVYAHGLSNFQIINCTFKDSISGTYGGALELVSANNVSIISCDFINNSAKLSSVPRGGAINWVSSTGGTITDCNFIANSADYGGAIRMEEVNGVHNYNNNFRNNKATNYGGDIMCDDNDANFHDCNFTNSHADNYGGSIYWKGSNTVIYNLNFYNVTSKNGGAIVFANCKNSTVKNSKFKKYRADTWGGAVCFMSDECGIEGCEFEDGSALYGGAVYHGRNMIAIKDSTFKNNNATGSGATGGAICIEGPNTVIDNCKFESSSSPTNGGTIMVYARGQGANITNCEFSSGSASMGGAIYSNGVNVLISGNDFIANTATIGGAVFSGSAGSRIVNNEFSQNNASNHGGAIYSVGANPEFVDNTYTANTAKMQAGALFFRGNYAVLNRETFIDNTAKHGGAITFDANNSQINNSYFRGNNATQGAAMFKGGNIVYINNATFVYNQAESTSLEVERSGNNFKVTFKAKNNILNAIENNGDLSGIFIDGVNPKASADESGDGELLYQDAREFDQIITATVLDENGEVIKTLTEKTDIYGAVYFSINEGYKVIFSHPEDVFYTGIEEVDYISSIMVEKIALTPVVVNSTQARFQIAVTNTGHYALENLTVFEDSFDGLIFDRFDEVGLWTREGLSWKFNSRLVPGEVALLTVYFNTSDVGEFTNVVSVKTAEDINGKANATVKVIPDTFEVKKVSLMPVTKVGDETIFEIIVHNTGETDIHNVYIIEDSHEGLIYSHTFEDHLWDYVTGADGKHMWVLKDILPAHEELGIFVVFKTTDIGNFTNYAIVGHEGATKTINATVWVNETVHEPENPNPQMNISIFTVHPSVMVDGEVWFEILVENTGNVVLNNVTVEEFMHDNLIFTGFEIDSGMWDYKPKILGFENRVELLGAPLEENHSWVVNTPLYQNEVLGFFVKFTPVKTGTHSNTVLGYSVETEGPLYATADVDVLTAEYSIRKVALNSSVTAGQQVTFQIIVHNTGDVEIEGMEIVENPDESLIFDHWYCDGETWGNEGETHYYLWEPIAPGGYSEFFVVYNTTKVGNITNVIGVGDEFFNTTVEVTNDTSPADNGTDPVDNQTTPENDTIDEDEHIEEVKPVGETHSFEASSTYSEHVKEYLAKIDKNATGHPLIALVVVLICLILRRRRD